ncbi:MAG: conjugal transfer protein TraI [Bacteroidetes bacterium]|nr:MAG: conjugal transfer protein TraI [Bacteroidota bacterium]
MKKIIMLSLLFAFGLLNKSDAQVTEIITVIKAAITKVIKAVDLEVQRMQTQTIWLQNAQKELENTLSLQKLGEITDWVEKTKDLYASYYQELSEVKSVIAGYDKVKTIIALQSRIISEYQTAYSLFRRDPNFSPPEIDYMYQVYSGILNESVKNVDQLMLVVNAFVTQMSDGERLATISDAAKAMQKNYNDLREFNNRNKMLSLQRTSENKNVESVKNLYGLP